MQTRLPFRAHPLHDLDANSDCLGRIAMSRLVLGFLVLFCLSAPFAPAPARAESRVALVIGNGHYAAVSRLDNPPRDAAAVAAALKNAGFASVDIESDLTREAMIKVLQRFEVEAEKADWAVIYFAGHGLEVGGVNYLVPVDAKLVSDKAVQDEAVSLDRLLSAIEGARKLKLVILDACRDDPFVTQMRRTSAGRSVGRGLGPIEPEGGTLVAYSAKHGQIALDGNGANSPFVTALVTRLREPGLEINKLFRVVRDDVLSATGKLQEPYQYGSLPGEDFYFLPPIASPVPVPPLAYPASKPPRPFTCGVLEDQLLLTVSNTRLSPGQFQKAISTLHEIEQNVSDSCELKKQLFDGPILEIHQCYNQTLYFELGGPRGGRFVWTAETQINGNGLPTQKGQLVLGVRGAPDTCLYSISPMIDIRAADSIKTMNFTSSSADPVPPAALPSSSPAPAAPGDAVFPTSVSPTYANEEPHKARVKTCFDQYKANKATNNNGGLMWIQKGGGYWSACNARLRG